MTCSKTLSTLPKPPKTGTVGIMHSLQPTLAHIKTQKPLSEDEMMAAMRIIMSGEASDAQIGAFIMGIAMRGEAIDELVGAAKVLREKAHLIDAPETALDCCGTGGDGLSTLNVSTAVAIVSAACGVSVAKHGNRAASSKSGAADVLEALDIPLTDDLNVLSKALSEIGFCFMMAPHHHKAMKHVIAARKELGFRNIFNLLGPLANPAATKYQLMGVFDRKWVEPVAETLAALGTVKAWVVHSADGLDEISISDKTYVAEVKDGSVTNFTVSPQDFGLEISSLQDIKGGDAKTNAAALQALLEGTPSAYADIVCANTAAVLVIRDMAPTLLDGMHIAQQAIYSGKALDILNSYRDFLET